jgi:hypothetical protein
MPEEKLYVGDRFVLLALHESRDPTGQICRKALTEDEAVGQAKRHPVEAHVSQQRALIASAIDQQGSHMVLQAFADAGKIHACRNAVCAQRVCVTDAG